MMSPADIDKSDFFLPPVKGVMRFIRAAIQLLKSKRPKLTKNTGERTFL